MANYIPLRSTPGPFPLQNSTYDVHDKELLMIFEAFKRWTLLGSLWTPDRRGHDHQNLQYFSMTKILTRSKHDGLNTSPDQPHHSFPSWKTQNQTDHSPLKTMGTSTLKSEYGYVCVITELANSHSLKLQSHRLVKWIGFGSEFSRRRKRMMRLNLERYSDIVLADV